MIATVLTRAAVVAAAASTIAAAQPRFDPSTGDYFVSVLDDQRRSVEMRVTPANKVRVVAQPAVSVEAGGYRYVYQLGVATDSPQSLLLVEIDCPTSSAMSSASADNSGIHWFKSHDAWPGRASCSFEPDQPLTAAASVSLSFRIGLLPAIGRIRAVGAVPAPRWPTLESIPENENERAVVESLVGLTGGWKELTAPVPGRDPATLTDPSVTLSYIAADLAAACGHLAWIANRGVCGSLAAKLDAAARSLTRGQQGAARGALASFAGELRAHRGRSVSENAYALLDPMVAFLTAQLR